MQDKFNLSKKQDFDSLINLIRRSDWKVQDFLYKNSYKYCKIICSKKNEKKQRIDDSKEVK